MNARAIFWTGPGQVDVRSLEHNDPGPGEVLIEVAYSLVSPGTEREWLSSDESHVVLGTTFPFVPGYSAAGRIAKVGAGVEGWSVGDRVVAGPVTGCHASHLVAPTELVVPVPDGVAMSKGVFFNLGMTAAHTLRISGLQPGGSLAIVGQGAIGALATQIARAQGAGSILALEIDEQRRAASKGLGATHVADPSNAADFDAVLAQLGGGVSASIDLSGSPHGLDTAVHATAPLGVVAMSTGRMAPLTINYGEVFVKGLTLVSAFVGARVAEAAEDTRTFLGLLDSGDVRTPDEESAVFDPEAAPEIYERVLAADHELPPAPIFRWSGQS